MMKKITALCVLALLCLNFNVNGQESKAVDVIKKGLQIGTQMPDLTLNNLNNYKDAKGKIATTAKISDFKGKLLILDFWATWCAPCVAMIPKMDSLQKAFPDKLQFLSVTYEAANTVLPLLSGLEKGNGKPYGLANLFEDEELHKLFPHVYLPHYVWIDQNGVICAITDSKPIKAKEIEKVFKSGYQQLVRKQDFKMSFDKTRPLFFKGNGGDGETITYRSLLATYIQGIQNNYYKKPADQGTEGFASVSIKNWYLSQLYYVALGAAKKNYVNCRFLYETRDSLLLDPMKKKDDWRKYAWCYELTLPPALQADGYRLMYEELNKLFPQYKVKVEKRLRTCYALKVIDQSKLLPVSGEPSNMKHIPTALWMRNGTLDFLVNTLEHFYYDISPIPIINLSGYAENIDIDINAKLEDIDAVNKELQKYGLAFVKGEHEIDMIVFRDSIK